MAFKSQDAVGQMASMYSRMGECVYSSHCQFGGMRTEEQYGEDLLDGVHSEFKVEAEEGIVGRGVT